MLSVSLSKWTGLEMIPTMIQKMSELAADWVQACLIRVQCKTIVCVVASKALSICRIAPPMDRIQPDNMAVTCESNSCSRLRSIACAGRSIHLREGARNDWERGTPQFSSGSDAVIEPVPNGNPRTLQPFLGAFHAMWLRFVTDDAPLIAVVAANAYSHGAKSR